MFPGESEKPGQPRGDASAPAGAERKKRRGRTFCDIICLQHTKLRKAGVPRERYYSTDCVQYGRGNLENYLRERVE